MHKNESIKNKRFSQIRFYALPIVLGALVVLLMQFLMPANTVRNLPTIANLRLLYNGRVTDEHPSGVFVYDFEKNTLKAQKMSSLPMSLGMYHEQPHYPRYTVSYDGTVVSNSPDGGVQVYPYWAEDPSYPMGIGCQNPAISADDQQIGCIDTKGIIWLGSRFSGDATPYFADERTFDVDSEFHISADYLVIQNNEGVWVADNATRQLVYQQERIPTGWIISPDGRFGAQIRTSAETGTLVIVVEFVTDTEKSILLPLQNAQEHHAMAWSPDGSSLIIGIHSDDQAHLYSLAPSTEVFTPIIQQSGTIWAVSYDSSGQYIAYNKHNGTDNELWFLDMRDKIPYFVDYISSRYPVAVFVNEPLWMREEEANSP
jgi:WD40 repeat protein